MGAEAHWPCTNGLHPVRQCGRVLRVHGILAHSADIPTRVRRGSQWRGGAKPHGPKIRSWGQKLNKKGVLCCVEAARFCGEASHVDVTPPRCHPTPMSVRALGLRMALAAAYHDRRLAVVDGVELEVRACVGGCRSAACLCQAQLHGAVSSRQRRATSLPCSGSMVGTIPVCCSSTVRCDGIFSVRVGGTCSVGSRHEGCFPLPQALSLMMASCLPRAM